MKTIITHNGHSLRVPIEMVVNDFDPIQWPDAVCLGETKDLASRLRCAFSECQHLSLTRFPNDLCAEGTRDARRAIRGIRIDDDNLVRHLRALPRQLG